MIELDGFYIDPTTIIAIYPHDGETRIRVTGDETYKSRLSIHEVSEAVKMTDDRNRVKLLAEDIRNAISSLDEVRADGPTMKRISQWARGYLDDAADHLNRHFRYL